MSSGSGSCLDGSPRRVSISTVVPCCVVWTCTSSLSCGTTADAENPRAELELLLLREIQDEPEVRENSVAWGELQASADLREVGSLLQNVNASPIARQTKRSRHSADSPS